MNKAILFSIVVPTYNRADLITKTIDSICKQTYKNYEIIIVDDGSTDNTEEILKPLLNDNIKYFKKENGERAAARNYGAKLAKGDYINWFDSDDLMLPNHLEEALKMIEFHNKPEAFAQSFNIITKDLSTIRKIILPSSTCNKHLYKENILACNPVFVRRDITDEFAFNENRKLSASEDYELWLRIASCYPIFTSSTITSILIEHDNRSVNLAASKQQIEDRFLTFLNLSLSDKRVVKFLGYRKPFFIARVYSLIATNMAINGYNKNSIKYIFSSLYINPFNFLHRHFFSSIKVLVMKFLIQKFKKKD